MFRRLLPVAFAAFLITIVPAGTALADVEPGSCASHVSGDFDSDGESDLAVGVPGQDVDGRSNAGGVHIVYGNDPNGLQAADDQFITQNSQGVDDKAESGDRFGSCLAAGDFNNDGEWDLAIGVPDENIETTVDAGAINVLYGSDIGLDAVGPPADDFWHQNSPGVSGVNEEEDGFGASLGAGDFDGDGFDDLAIGVPYDDISDIVDAGAINVLYGNNGGLFTTGQQLWSQNVAGMADTSERRDEFGSSLATGDMDSDGQDDLAIGVPGERVGTETRAGAVHVMYSGAAGLNANNDRLWTQDSTGIEEDAEEQDRFGTAVVVADFDADGADDLAVGTPLEDNATDADVGGVNVIYGSNDGLESTDDQFFDQSDTGGAAAGDAAEAGDLFGTSLAAADFEDDGNDDADLAVGAPGEDSSTGAVEVVYGDPTTGLDPTAGTTDYWVQSASGETSETGDEFGAALTAGDYDNNDIFDLAIGAPGEDIGTEANAGAVNVIYGATIGLDPATTPAAEFWHQDNLDDDDDGATAGDRFGAALG